MSSVKIEQALAGRFTRELDRLLPAGNRIGLAVSGGPDSLALLLLAHETRPQQIEAATVDHGLRPESSAEARLVASLCAARGIPHERLRPGWAEPPRTAVQEKARAARYAALGGWAIERGLAAIATAHHREDQAETLMMRLARGAGIRGLAGMRAIGHLPECPAVKLIRPLLAWSKHELHRICIEGGVDAAHDPSNDDARFERVRVRQALAGHSWIGVDALSRSAANLAQADEALEWAAAKEWSQVAGVENGEFTYRPTAPAEIRRRVAARLLRELRHEGTDEPRGREMDRLMATLEGGGTATLRGVRCSGGAAWRFSPAPARAATRRRPH